MDSIFKLSSFILMLLAFLGVGCVVPYETAKMIPDGGSEWKGAITYVAVDKITHKYSSAIGIGYGYGYSDKFNIKYRYEFVHGYEDNGLHFLSVSPKFSLIQDKLALITPFSLLRERNISSPILYLAVSPGLLYTHTFSQAFESTFGARADLFLRGKAAMAFNLGFGITKPSAIWTIRPEVGIVFDFENEHYLTIGVGVDFKFLAKE
ncbi:MAG: hypothetical protein H6576_13615 [Lewinellaceae bacterium]|nr:hypothetical protein [Saprospiraceae bacterium]MCB9344736.1 hypothetical protein [Lewinellaceae bacterium]